MLAFLLIYQSTPEDDSGPRLVQPCLDKLDIHHLLSDLPKYKPWLSAASWNEWEVFMKNHDKLKYISMLQWKLQMLADSGKQSEHARSQIPAPQINPETAALFSKEAQKVDL